MTLCCVLVLQTLSHAQALTGQTPAGIKRTYTLPHEGSPPAHKAAIDRRQIADPACTQAMRLAMLAGKAVAALLPVTCGHGVSSDSTPITTPVIRVAQRKKKP